MSSFKKSKKKGTKPNFNVPLFKPKSRNLMLINKRFRAITLVKVVPNVLLQLMELELEDHLAVYQIFL